MEEQSSSDFYCTSWIQYFYIPAFFTLGTLETVLVCQVEYDQDSVRFLEIVFRQWKEFLLARSVPNAKRDLIIIQSNNLLLQTEPQRWSVKMAEWTFIKTEIL